MTLVSPGFVDSDIRRTNNRGELQSDAPDPIPAWVRVKTEVAVREIIRGVERRRPEIVVTGHGKLIVFMARHFSGLLRWFGMRVYQARPEPRAPKA